MFSVTANTTYAIEDGQHSLEISYIDSDGVNVGAYATGNSFEEVITDAVDQLDEAIAEYDDDQADVEEAADLQAQIADLQAQIAQLQARNDELEKRHAEKLNHKNTLDDDIKKILNNFRKESNISFNPKWFV